MNSCENIYTIDRIARELGVSRSAVARTVSGIGRVSQSVKERVLGFLRERGCAPETLDLSRTYNLGIVMPSQYSSVEYLFFQECIKGCTEAAREFGYDTMMIILVPGDSLQVQRMVAGHKVDGMILTRSVENSRTQKYLKSKKVPYVVIGPERNPDVICVDNQNREACQEMTEYLLKRGFRSLALLGGNQEHLVTEDRWKGFLAAHEKWGVLPDKRLIFMGSESYGDVAKAVDAALAAKADCLVCMDDYLAGYALKYLKEKNISVPERIRLVSFYDSPVLEQSSPSVTSIRFNTRSVARKACCDLLRQLGETIPEENSLPNYQMYFRDSTA